MKTKISVIMLVSFLCMFFTGITLQMKAEAAAVQNLQKSVQTITNGTPAAADPDEQFRSESRSWYQKIGDTISDIVESIRKIFTKGLSFLIDITIGNILQGFYNKVADGMAKWIFLTPKLIGSA